MTTTVSQKKLLLIAGFGSIVKEFALSTINQNRDLTVFSFDKANTRKLKKLGVKVFDFCVFEIFEMLEEAKTLGIEEISFIGKVPKSSFFKNIHKLNKELVKEIWHLKDLSDDSLHLKIVEKLEGDYGLKIIDQTLYIKHLFPKEQVFTIRKPSAHDLDEISYGLKMAKANASLDIGQTVVTRNKSIIAVEAIEGTNECIKRARRLIRFFDKNKVLYVSKVAKPNQDRRFDIPTVGLETIKAIPKSGVLCFEAKETFFIDQEKAIELANKKNICIISKSYAE